MNKVVRIAHNAIWARLIDADRALKLRVQQLLSYEVEGHEQMESFKSHHWDGRSSFFEMRKDRFPAGFVQLVYQVLQSEGYEVQVFAQPRPRPLGFPSPRVDKFGYEDSSYDYQPEIAERLLKFGRMIAQVATGGGKSRIAQIATARLRRPTLFLTTRSVLMYQMRDHFQAMNDCLRHDPNYSSFMASGHKVGVLGDGEWDPRRWVNVGMVQTLAARLKEPDPREPRAKQEEQLRRRNETLKLLERFELLILEEAHEASGQSYYDIANKCINAHYRLALTATPFMKADEEANMMLMAVAGPVGYQVTEQELIERGILARPYFKYIEPEKPPLLFRTTDYTRAYRVGIVESAPRNAHILREAMRAASIGLPVMVLIQRKTHGKLLQQAFTKHGLKCQFIFGDTDAQERRKALTALGEGKIQVLIGSTILDVGVDVPAVGMVILAGGNKAEVQLRQRIGRGLRRKKTGPNVALIVDFMDTANKHLHKHSVQRREIILRTPGFAENVLPSGQDFDFEGLGLARKCS